MTRQRVSRTSQDSPGSVLDVLRAWYHIPILGVLMSFMFFVRVQSYDRFVRNDGTVLFSGVDPWYHYRTTLYTVRNYPSTMPYDTWTNYPYGSQVGGFGTAFDQLIATVALLVGLGSPSPQTVDTVFLFTPVVMGVLVAIPTYYIGTRLGGRIGGLTGVLLLALFPGTFFYRSSIGFTDHHVAEVLFMTIAVWAMMVAVTVAEREKPVYELLADRDLGALRRPFGYSVLAGVAIALYLWNWPPGVVLVGIFGFFFAIKLSADFVRGVSPDHLAFVGAVSHGIVAILLLATIETTSFSATSFGPLQVLLPAMVAIGCVFMAWLARVYETRDFDPKLYPVAIGVLFVVGLAFIAILLPGMFSTIQRNVARILLFGQTDTTLTIQEAQAVENVSAHVFNEFGLAFYTAMGGLIVLAARPLFDNEHRTEYFLILIWAVFITLMAFTQVRFNYYYAVTIAVLNAYAVGLVVERADVDIPTSTAKLRDIKGYQVMALLVIVLLLFVPLMPPIAEASVVDRGDRMGPNGDAVKWEPANDWLASHTPQPGTYGNVGSPMDPYGTYPRPADGDFDYPDGAYGVMSWWDYGHLIAVQAERIPHANPFQQGARASSAFLQAQTEAHANLLLDALPMTGNPQQLDDDALWALVDENEDEQDGAGIRYVMIDDSMAAGKFSAIATWTGPGYQEHVDFETVDLGDNETAELPVRGERYESTTLSRLYFDDASGMETYRLVHETERQTIIGSLAQRDQEGTWHPIQVNQELSFQLVTAAQQHPDFAVYDLRQAAAVKTFERVEGAQLTGQTDEPAGTTVVAALELTTETSNRTIVYRQEATVDDDGTFSLTVPYATTNDLGPGDGYTNTSVHAEGAYTVYVGDEGANEVGTVEVPEQAIYDGDTVDVELEPAENDVEVPDEAPEEGDPESDEDEAETGENPSDETGTNGSEEAGTNNSDETNDDETSSVVGEAPIGGH